MMRKTSVINAVAHLIMMFYLILKMGIQKHYHLLQRLRQSKKITKSLKV